MSKHFKPVFLNPCALVVATMIAGGMAFGQVQTGTFSSPEKTAFLSVDINGGQAAYSKPTEGFNEDYSNPIFTADPYGVTWSGWGGSNSQSSQSFGDGTVWPENTVSQAGTASNTNAVVPNNPFPTGSPLVNNVNYFQKTFTPTSSGGSTPASVTVAISAPGTAGQYGTDGYPITSRDNGPIQGEPSANQDSPAAEDIDMWRDYIVSTGTGSNVQGENFLQVQFSGLQPNTKYTGSFYSYNQFYGHGEAWSTVPPAVSNNILGWWAASPEGNNTFTPPSDEQQITWQSASSNTFPGAQTALTLITDSTGTVSAYTWGNQPGQSTQWAAETLINGFQLSGGTALLLGDTNGDGAVDHADLTTLMANMGQSFTDVYSRGYAIGDFNGDGVVNQDDFGLFQLGAAEYDAAHSAAAPEPAGAAMVLAAGVLLGLRRRKLVRG